MENSVQHQLRILLRLKRVYKDERQTDRKQISSKKAEKKEMRRNYHNKTVFIFILHAPLFSFFFPLSFCLSGLAIVVADIPFELWTSLLLLVTKPLSFFYFFVSYFCSFLLLTLPLPYTFHEFLSHYPPAVSQIQTFSVFLFVSSFPSVFLSF